MSEIRRFTITMRNEGMRSRIDCTLCHQCPRDDRKGCCHYGPSFTVVDIGYLAFHGATHILDQIVALPRLTFLSHEVKADALPDDDGSFRCQFHSPQGGCLLPAPYREFICRQFLCPGVGVWHEPEAKKWQRFWDVLTEYDTEVYQRLGSSLHAQGLTLMAHWHESVDFLAVEYPKLLAHYPDELIKLPKEETFELERPVVYGKEWRI